MALLMASGCSIQPRAISSADHKLRLESEARKMYAAQEPLKGPLTLNDGIARAIRYNMEYRTRMMEVAGALGQLDVANFDLLPKMTMSAGYTQRNNDAFSYGFTTEGTTTSSPSGSMERIVSTSKAAFSWNILDFGLSYYRSKQLADQSLMAEERRRKALQNLVLDVRMAYWKARAGQELLPDIGVLLEELDRYTKKAEFILTQRLMTPLQVIAYRRSLLDMEQQMVARANELVQARIDFSTLINLAPGQAYTLVTDAQEKQNLKRDFTADLEKLDRLALELRPELREEGYRERLTEIEKSRATLQALLPSLSLEYGWNTNSNKYLVNQAWTQVGSEAALNLVKAFSLPAIGRAAEAQKGIDDARRSAQIAAVLSQIRIAVSRYEVLSKEFEYWSASVEDDTRVVETMKSSVSVGIEADFELIRAKGKLINTRISAALSYANLQAAIGRIYSSIGLDSLPREMAANDLASLSQELNNRLSQWEGANFTVRQPLVLPKISVRYSSNVPPPMVPELNQAMAVIFKSAEIEMSDPSDYTVIADLTISKNGEGKTIAVVKGTIEEASSHQTIFTTEQKSTLVEPVTARQWSALGEAIAYPISDFMTQKFKKSLPQALKVAN
ncbi:MAG: TolC family protein [Hylemonella sp.]